MRLVPVPSTSPGFAMFAVEDITAEDIGEPSELFLEFVDGLTGFPALTRATVPVFMQQVRDQYVTSPAS